MMYKYLKIFSIFLFVCFIQTAQSDKCHELFKPLNMDEIQSIFSDPANYIKYRGQEGYLLFVQKTPNSDIMDYVFKMVSKVLGKNFNELGWQSFHGLVNEFRDLRGKILNESGKPKEKYLGMDGYALFAEDHYEGSMLKAFMNVSSVLSKSEFNNLGWQQFQGLVSEFRDLRGKILDERGKPKDKYLGMDGYALFAKEHYEGSMLKAFMNVSSVLSKSEFNNLGWQSFHGLVNEFRDLRGKILDESGKPKDKYLGMDGYALFAEDHYEGNMEKAFKNVSSVLSKSEFNNLGWQQFQGLVSEFRDLRGKILDERGKPKDKYLGMDGYALFAKEHYEGSMLKAFMNVSSVLSKSEFNNLGWQSFHGLVNEFRDLRGKILDERGKPKEKYLGMDGYALFAKDHYGGVMLKAFQNVSSVLSKSEFNNLGWQQFQGLVNEFRDLRGKILDERGKPKDKYLGMDGYALFAKEHYEGNMKKTFLNVSSVLSKSEFNNLGWQEFHGLVNEFRDLRGKILDERGKPKDKYLGMDGYALFAEDHYEGNMEKAFKNVSSVLGESEFNNLGWQEFHGLVSEFHDLRGKILDERGKPKEKYLGMDGYALFSEDHYEDFMQKAFINVSSVLGGHINMKILGLDWKKFNGNASEYWNLIQLFKDNDIIKLKGVEGQKRVAKEVFKDDIKRTHRNVSILRETLLGSWEAFKDLEWSSNL